MGIRTDNVVDRIMLFGNRRLGRKIYREERRVYIGEKNEDKVFLIKLPEAVRTGNIIRVRNAIENDIKLSRKEIENLVRVIHDIMIINFRQIKDLKKIKEILESSELKGSNEVQKEVDMIKDEIKKFEADFNDETRLLERLRISGGAPAKIGDFFNVSRESIQIARASRRIIRRVENFNKKVKHAELKLIRKKSEEYLRREVNVFNSYLNLLEKEEGLFKGEQIDTVTLLQKKLLEYNPDLIKLIQNLIDGQGFPQKIGRDLVGLIEKRVSEVQDDIKRLHGEMGTLSRKADEA